MHISLFLSLFVCLFLFVSFSLSRFLWSFPLSLSICLFLFISFYLSFNFIICLFHCFSLVLYISQYVFFYLSISQFHSIFFSLPFNSRLPRISRSPRLRTWASSFSLYVSPSNSLLFLFITHFYWDLHLVF